MAILVALVSAVDTYAMDLFSIHMAQHMLLTVVAAPLLWLGQPIRPLVRGLPPTIRARIFAPLARNAVLRAVVHQLRAPVVTVLLYVVGLYYWHIPAIYDAALADPPLHMAEHAWFLGSALLFWSNVIDPEPFRARLPYPARILYLLLAGAGQNTILGGLLAFSSRLLYQWYRGRPEQYGIEALTDQRIGGGVMWVPGDLIFLTAASFAFFAFLRSEEDEQNAREAKER